MTLKLLSLTLKISTSAGEFGTIIPFNDGLFILHTDNTSGKSTCLQSIIYALGLEGMLGPSRAIPLPPSTTENLEYNGEKYDVLESEVLLKISNGADDITVRRQIKGNQSNNLITVIQESQLQADSSSFPDSYFVREPGSASRERGFHTFLAQFIGWNLPLVPTYRESEAPLYMETLFPFIYVEQKHGWSNLRNRFPTHLGIKDVGRRSPEFFLGLDAQENANKKIILKQKQSFLKERWSAKIQECRRLLSSINGGVEHIPAQPVISWPPSIQPEIYILYENERISIAQASQLIRRRVQELEMQDVPTVETVIDSSVSKLNESQNELLKLESRIKLSFERLQIQLSSVGAVRARISGLRTELTRSRDLEKLARLGAVQELMSCQGVCPTCEQDISDSLIFETQFEEPMTVEQNTEFIKEQLKVFEAMERNEISQIAVQQEEINGLKSFSSTLREEIRALKTTLTSQNDAPSYSFIEEKIRLSERQKNLSSLRTQMDLTLSDFEVLSEEWKDIQSELNKIPDKILSKRDFSKLRYLEKSFQQQLSEYGFSSVSPSDVRISENTYFPEYEDFDLQFDCSASDYVRLIWAYLLGLMEVDREYPTNHLGLLILDEPRQQSAQGKSVKNFFDRASQAVKHGQQIIVATSESQSILNKHLEGIQHSCLRIDGRIIAPI